MTWIKICGITNPEDAAASVDAGADALGFVLYERSPRKMSVGQVREITSLLAPSIEFVGVFVDISLDVMINISRTAGLKGMQLHRTDLFQPKRESSQPDKEAFTACCAGDLKLYYALPARGLTWESSGHHPDIRILLDSSTKEQPGGTGKPFDWAEASALVAQMRKDVNVIVAGGLTPQNVGSAIRMLRPWGVDVSSGVEVAPGKKDPEKVRAFIRAVREADEIA